MNTKTTKLCEWNMCWQQWTSRLIGLLKQTRIGYKTCDSHCRKNSLLKTTYRDERAGNRRGLHVLFCLSEVKCNSRSNTPLPISKHKHVKWHWNNVGGRWWHCCYSDGGRWNCCNNDWLPTRGHLCTPRQPHDSACSAADARITTIELCL